MGSLTKTTETRRRRKRAKNGRDQKRARAKAGTPKFPVHPGGPRKDASSR